MSNEIILNPGTKLTLQTAGALVANGAIVECTTGNRQPTNNPGYTLGIFEFTSVSFSASPTAGAFIDIYEQKINSNAADAPNVTLTYPYDYLGSFAVDITGGIQNPSLLLPIHRYGGKYWAKWQDGAGGTASLSAGWELALTPCAYGNT